jgi:drug/metabolite transporter (DMT)-like permease
MNKNAYLIGYLMSVLGAVLFSSKAIFVKLIYQSDRIDAISMLALRMLFALPFYAVMALLISRKVSEPPLTRKQWVWLVALGILGYYLSSLLDFMGLAYISAGLERLILFLYPTFALLMAAAFFKKPITRNQGIALLIAYAGMLVAFFGDVQDAWSIEVIWGSLLILGCTISYASYIVGGGHLIQQIGSVRFTTYAMLVATAGVFLQYGIQHGVSFPEVKTSTYWMCFIMAVFATVIPTFLMNAGIQKIGTSDAAIVTSLGPVATIIQAYWFLGEPITWVQILGTALVLLGVLWIGKSAKKNERQ